MAETVGFAPDGMNRDVRDLGAPDRILSSYARALGGRRRDFSCDFRLSPHSPEIGLFVRTAGNGVLDLLKLKMIELSEQNLIGEIKAMYPQASAGNLLHAPLCLPPVPQRHRCAFVEKDEGCPIPGAARTAL